MKCPSLSSLKSYIDTPPAQMSIKAAKFGASLVLAGASSMLAKQVYDISLQILNNSIQCPYIQLSSLACGMVASAYCSFKIGQSMESERPSIDLDNKPRRFTQRDLRPSSHLASSVSPGEESKSTSESHLQKMKMKQVMEEISAFHPGEGAYHPNEANETSRYSPENIG